MEPATPIRSRYVQTIGTVLGVALFAVCGWIAFRQLESPPAAEPAPTVEKPAFRGMPTLRLGTGKLPAAPSAHGNVFRGSVYYTPRESGFRAEAGFDVTPTTKPGLGGRNFPRDFLKVVEIEGFGRMRAPVEGKGYVRCWRGQWGFASAPVDRLGRPLRPLRSAAVSMTETLLPPDTVFRVQAAGLPTPFREASWVISDTGSGLAVGQIDFYWGEDDPLGPGPRLTRPRGMPMPLAQSMIVVMR